MSRIRWYGPTILLLVTVLAIMFAGPTVARQMAYSYQAENIHLVRESLVNNSQLDQLSNAFRQISKVVEPSVVHIQVAAHRPPGARRGGPMENGPEGMDPDNLPPWLRQWFFGDQDPQSRRQPQQQNQKKYEQYNPLIPYANGSGWVYDNKGHIITNNHVVDGAEKITIRFHDDTERTATVVGTDPKTDIAVLQVEGESLHPAVVAPQPVQQGDLVFAFGSPFGFKFSMSQGIVSAVGRNRVGIIAGGYEDFIQTDAAINPGNSGGPLTDIHGEVIGMNTAIASRTGANNGLGFAIPASTFVPVIESIIKHGRVKRGFVGVSISDLETNMARTFNYDGKGVLVVDPIPGTPGAKAGLKAGDIIAKLNGTPMTSAEQLRNTVAAMEPGTDVSLDVFRNGKHQQVKLTIGELPNDIAMNQPDQNDDSQQPTIQQSQGRQALMKLGIMDADTLTPDIRQQLGNQGPEKGAVIKSVRSGSVAEQAGIRPGAVITEVMGQPIDDVQALVQEFGKQDITKGVRIRMFYGDQPAFIVLQIEK